jgi:3-oxoacyl-[acyl-carrier protein] reductase
VIGFTKAVAKEVGPSGIRVNCISPGMIDTDMNASVSEDAVGMIVDETPLCRTGTPADVARVMMFLASDAAAFITGQVISVNGGLVI